MTSDATLLPVTLACLCCLGGRLGERVHDQQARAGDRSCVVCLARAHAHPRSAEPHTLGCGRVACTSQVPDVRTVLRKLRDAERAPHGAPVPPDLITLQQVKRFEDIGVEGAVGAAVKAATTQLLALSQKL